MDARRSASPAPAARAAVAPTVTPGRIAIGAILVAVGLAQGADAVTFLRLMWEHGPAAELNPIVRAGVIDLGLVPLIAAKAALIVFVVAACAIIMRTRARLSLVVATAGTVAGLVGAFSNVLAL